MGEFRFNAKLFLKRASYIFLTVCVFTVLLSQTFCQKKSEKSKKEKGIEKSIDKELLKESSKKWEKMISTDLKTGEIAKNVPGTVKVVSFNPQGQLNKISQSDEINITFSRSIAPLEEISEKSESLIDLVPAVKGEGYFKSTNTYTYVLKEKLVPSTKYKIKFKGYSNISGIKVSEFNWEFITPRIKILKTTPRHNKKWSSLGQRVIVKFSQAVNPSDIKSYIKLRTNSTIWENHVIKYSTEKERKQLYYWASYRKNPKKFITISPTKYYPLGTDISVEFKKGLPSLSGNLGMLSDKVLKFRTYEKFEISVVKNEFNPDRGIRIKTSNKVSLKEFFKNFTIKPEIRINRSNYWQDRDFHVRGDFKPNTTYTITVKSGLRDIYKNGLKNDFIYEVKSMDYSPYLIPPSGKHYVLENYLKKVIPVRVRNVFSTDVFYKKLTLDEIDKMSNSGSLNFKSIKEEDCNLFSWDLPVKKNQHYNLVFPLKDLEIDDPGIYYIKFKKATNYGAKTGTVFQLTNNAIVAKYSPTQIFLTSFNLENGTLGKNLSFNILNDNYNEREKSNDQGIAVHEPKDKVFFKENLFDFKVHSKEGNSFIWGRKNEMFNMWDFEYDYNINFRYSPESYYNNVLAFTDKKLYKAGQEVKFKGIFRQLVKGELRIPEVERIEGEVINSENKKIKEFEIGIDQFNNFGTFADKFKLPEKTPSGFYIVKLKISMEDFEDKYKTEFGFSVQEYKPAKFEVKTRFDQKYSFAGEKFSGKVTGRYLFGTPMKKSGANYNLRIKNIYYTPRGWQKYSFGTSESSTNKTITRKEVALNDDGEYDFVRQKFYFNTKNSVRLSLYGEVIDKDNNRISNSTSMVVHRGKYYIGVKTDSYFFTQGEPGNIHVVTVDPAGKKTSDQLVNLLIEKIEWKSFQKKDASGSLRWNWEKIVKKIDQRELNLQNGEIAESFTFQDSGYYKITLTGTDENKNLITTTANFYVTGKGYVSWKIDEGRIIDLVTDKKKYEIGDTVKLLIKSPFKSATALITGEREKVFWYKTVKLEGNTSTIDIPVTEDFLPNIFFNVLILKERTGLKWDNLGNDIGKPEFYTGYTEVQVNSEVKKLKLTINSDKSSYGPADQVNLEIKVTDHQGKPVQSEICLSVVDKGVLNLIGYELPDPFQFFYKKRPLDIRTVSTLLDVLGRRKFSEKSENPGGGTGSSPFGSIVVRKNFKESAFYSANIKTDQDGIARIPFSLPDNLTTFKAMAVCVDKQHRFGKGNKEFLVKKELVLKPALPDFLRPGDVFKGGVTVTNNSPDEMKVKVKAEVKNIEVAEDTDFKEVTVQPYETNPVLFSFRVKSDRKIPELTFKASAGSFDDGYRQSITLRMPQFPIVVASSGSVDQKSKTEHLIIPKNSKKEFDQAEITLSSSISAGTKQSYEYLRTYPYDCLEQKISKNFPILKKNSYLVKLGFIKIPRGTIEDRINRFIKDFSSYQHSSGGFKYYPDSIYISWYLSAFATDFLLEAKKEGYQIDPQVLSRAEGYLKKVCKNSVESKYPYSQNIKLLNVAYATHVLAKNGYFARDTINNLYEEREKLPLEGLAYLVKTLDIEKSFPDTMQVALVRIMLNKIKQEPTRSHFENYQDDYWWTVHGSTVKTTAIIFETLLDVYKRFPLAPKIAKWLQDSLKERKYLTTQEHLYMIRAFQKYFDYYETANPEFVAEFLLNNEVKYKSEVKKRDYFYQENLSLKGYNPGDQIKAEFKKNGRGILYYLLRMSYFPKGNVPAINRGFEIKRQFFTESGTRITDNQFTAGKKYIVELEIKTSQDRSFVIVNDPVAAGFKVVNPSFKTSSEISMEKVNRANKYQAYWGKFYRSQYYFDRVELFADFLRTGTHRWKYLVIATNSGEFDLPNSMVLEMYNPEVFGRNENRKIQIK